MCHIRAFLYAKNRDIEKAIYSIEQGYAEDDRQQVLKLLNDAVGILEKDQQKRICWNRKEALNNQSPKHGIQRIFTISAGRCIVVTAKRNRNNFIKVNVIFE